MEKSQTNATNVTLHLLGQVIWGDIRKHTLEKSQINAINVTLHPHRQAIWGGIWKHIVEKSQASATYLDRVPAWLGLGNLTKPTMPLLMQAIWGYIWKRTVEKSQITWPADLRIHFKSHSGEKSIDAASVIMHPLEQATLGTTWKRNRVFLCSFKKFEITFDNTQWRKVKSMQPMPFCLLWSECFEAGILASSKKFGSSKVSMISKICIVFGKNSQRIRIRILFGLRKPPEYEYE